MTHRHLARLLSGVLGFGAALCAQVAPDTKLVKVDAIVTAPEGQPPPHLQAEDFEVLENGKPQRITSYSSGEHHTVVLMVDNCNAAFSATEPRLRQFLGGVISTGLRPGDRMAILNGMEGSAAAQQLTDDPRTLRAQVDRLRFPGRLMDWCVDASRGPVPILIGRGGTGPSGEDRMRVGSNGHTETLALQELALAIDYLSGQPGHKDLVWIGIVFRDAAQARSKLDEVIQRANRAGVSLHVVYPSEAPGPPSPAPLPAEPAIDERGLSNYKSAKLRQSMLVRMTQETGGLYFECPHISDQVFAATRGVLSGGIASIYSCEPDPFRDTGGKLRFLLQSWKSITSEVYTLGYRAGATASGERKIAVRVLRAGLTAHSRTESYDASDAVAGPGPGPLRTVLEAPMTGSAIRVEATPYESADATLGGRFRSLIRLAVSIDPDDVSWVEQGGHWRASVQVVAAASEGEGRAVNADKDCELEGPGAQCILEMAFDAPGFYVVRAAVRDRATGKTGFAYAVAVVSDHNAGRMTLSQPVLTRVPAESGRFSEAVFAPGTQVGYEVEAYGMQVSKKHGGSDLIYRIGLGNRTTAKNVFVGPETAAGNSGTSGRATIKGHLDLPKDLEPGAYVLEFWVQDRPGKVQLTRFCGFRVPGE